MVDLESTIAMVASGPVDGDLGRDLLVSRPVRRRPSSVLGALVISIVSWALPVFYR